MNTLQKIAPKKRFLHKIKFFFFIQSFSANSNNFVYSLKYLCATTSKILKSFFQKNLFFCCKRNFAILKLSRSLFILLSCEFNFQFYECFVYNLKVKYNNKNFPKNKKNSLFQNIHKTGLEGILRHFFFLFRGDQ